MMFDLYNRSKDQLIIRLNSVKEKCKRLARARARCQDLGVGPRIFLATSIIQEYYCHSHTNTNMRRTGSLLVLGASIAYAASDVPRPRGVGPECNNTPSQTPPNFSKIPAIADHTPLQYSCQILQGHHRIHLHLKPFHQDPILSSQRRLLRLPGRLRRTRNGSMLISLPAVTIFTLRCHQH